MSLKRLSPGISASPSTCASTFLMGVVGLLACGEKETDTSNTDTGEETTDTGEETTDTGEETTDTGEETIVDADNDGIVESDDCDDNDPNSTVVAEDADCDGVVTADDCDDSDNSLGAIANDADCDGAMTTEYHGFSQRPRREWYTVPFSFP